jgi:EmrB/QacA subfamily drug resistance transporter
LNRADAPPQPAAAPTAPPTVPPGAERAAAAAAGAAAPPAGTERVTRRPLVLVAMMLAMFMSAVEATIVATALPTIVAELGGFRWFSWVFAIYLLTAAVAVPVYGKLADMYGRKPVFYAGTALFLLGSTLCGFARGMGALIAFRALQGLGAGSVQPLAMTVVGDIYPGAERARVQGWIASVWGVSSVIGPALGAFFVQKLHWSLVFWVNIPIGLLAAALLAAFLHERVERRPHRVDVLGSLLMMVGTSALMLALIQASALPAAALGALLALAAGCAWAFLRVERRAPEPMMPPALWRHPIIVLGNVGSLATGALMMGVTSFLPSYVQGVMGRAPAVAGFTLAAMSVGWPLASTLGGRLMVRSSYRFSAVLGGLALLAGSALLIALTPARGPLWAAAGAFFIGAGMGFSTTAYLVSIQTAVDWQRRGVATSSNMFMRIVGMALGAAALGAVLNLGLHARLPAEGDVVSRLMERASRAALAPGQLAALQDAVAASLHDVYVITAVLAAIALALAWRYPRGLRPGAPH